jgi:hypothetical protein
LLIFSPNLFERISEKMHALPLSFTIGRALIVDKKTANPCDKAATSVLGFPNQKSLARQDMKQQGMHRYIPVYSLCPRSLSEDTMTDAGLLPLWCFWKMLPTGLTKIDLAVSVAIQF